MEDNKSRVVRNIPRLLLSAGIVVGSVIVRGTPARAATNGQQISFCAQKPALRGGYAVASGINQNGKRVRTHKIKLRGAGNCENLQNWWYKGTVTIDWHDHTGKELTKTYCTVPKVKNTNWIDCDDVPIHDQLVSWLDQEIHKNVNSKIFKDIKRRWHNGGADRWTRSLSEFYQQVKSRGPWDHKGYLRQRFGGRAYEKDPRKGAFFFQWDQPDQLLSYDFWSNFHYGYVGRMAGIDADVLSGAHRVPLLAGRTDAGDILAVKMGIDFYSKYGAGVTPARIAEFMAQHKTQLFNTHMAKSVKPVTETDGPPHRTS